MKKYGLIGYPLGHSFSKSYFSQKFEESGIDAEYVNFEIPDVDLLQDIISNEPDLRGLNVTIPYKEKVLPYMDYLSDEARVIGAVNCIRIDRKEKGKDILTGYNTDVIGFQTSLERIYHSGMVRALILGTGGAAKAVGFALARMGIEFKYVSRYPDDLQLSYIDASRVLPEVQIVINATPVGMYPEVEQSPPLTYEMISDTHLLYDLIYNPVETAFMKKGKAQGAFVKNGLEMLELQAEAGWEIWN